MDNKDFWESIIQIIHNGFTPEGLKILDYYANLFTTGRLLFKRFSPNEQHGCSAGGSSNVIATILSGTKIKTNTGDEKLSDFKRELKQAEEQVKIIERWAKKVGIWTEDVDAVLANSFGNKISEGGEAKVYDNGSTLIKSIGLDYYILPNLALDRIALHNAYFPETCLAVIGFGRDSNCDFKILVEQQYIEGSSMTEDEIRSFVEKLGFKLMNPRNWTYATTDIYLSDMHDENLIKSKSGNVFVIDCDIRINTPNLKQGGTREYSSEVEFI